MFNRNYKKMKSFALVAFAALFMQVSGHGSMWKPASRNSMWRFGFENPPNWNDNELYCGGVGVQWAQNGGKCGVCGDSYSATTPRDHENGGTYGNKIIAGTYASGSVIDVNIHLSASHLGDFTFSLCNLDNAAESEECFKPIKLADGSDKWTNIPAPQDYNIKVQLPQGVKCKQCALRWHYHTGNSYGDCGNGSSALGCGPQETFRNCADITIN